MLLLPLSLLAAGGLFNTALAQGIGSGNGCSGASTSFVTTTSTTTITVSPLASSSPSHGQASSAPSSGPLITTSYVTSYVTIYHSRSRTVTPVAAVSVMTTEPVGSNASPSSSSTHGTNQVTIDSYSAEDSSVSKNHPGSTQYKSGSPRYTNSSVAVNSYHSASSTSGQASKGTGTAYMSSSLASPVSSSASSFPYKSVNTSSSYASPRIVSVPAHSTFTLSGGPARSSLPLASGSIYHQANATHQTGTGARSDMSSAYPTKTTPGSRGHTPAWANGTSFSYPSPTPTACGEHGNFTFGWDDAPVFTPSNGDQILYPPVFNPYHHFFFSNGYAYVPKSEDPFQPISPPAMAIFLPNASSHDIGSPSAAGARPGELGAGPRAMENVYWFNAYGAWFGCDNAGPDNCQLVATGFSWDAGSSQEVQQIQHAFSISPCPGMSHCQLEHVALVGDWQALSGLQIAARVGGKPVPFYIDNLSMGWYNNSCAAGLDRIMMQK